MNIYISGVWDLLHVGHLNILERAKNLGGTLIVGVNTDELVQSYKRKPVISYEERKRIVNALKCVDKTIPHPALNEVEMLDKYNIDVVVVSSEWGKLPGQQERRRYINKTDRKLVVFPYTEGISTSKIIEKLNEMMIETIKIVGMGNVGKALNQLIIQAELKHFQIKTWDREYSSNDEAKPVDFLHICFPYSDNFIRDVLAYYKKYKAKLVIIHSTVKPGTTRELYRGSCPVAYSPIIGPHKKLNLVMPLFTKMVAAPQKEVLSQAMEHLGVLGFRLKPVKSVEGLELGKLLSTLYFGWCIAFQKEAHKICKEQSVYDTAYNIFNRIYNENYKLLEEINESNYHPIRPLLNNMPGKIGGTCIIPNAKLLEEFCPNELSEFLLRMNEKWTRTLGS